ncbi:substrate-binding domain-containing protein [Leifsonia kafniensis]|uniref:Substrate-binding domain-containing protein n=1 Tax=Leifsonia kafniensis TaxID=475957 RepID=A0ABP7KR52_9MICO
MKSRKALALCAVVGVTIAGLALSAPAQADPVSNSYALVGSDTLQDAGNALANGTNVTGTRVRAVAADGTSIGSFDAFGSAAIQTKSSGVYFARPAGSGDGVKALSRSIDGAPYSVAGNTTPAISITGQVDIARSSSGPASAAIDPNGLLAYVPFGRDALSYAYNGTGLDQLTGAQLKNIYECTLTVVNGVTVTPVLPQSGSGTAKFFLGAIGNPTLGSCVVPNVAENDGTVLNAAGKIVPFSVASWVAQKNGAAQNRTGTATLLGSTQGATAAFTGSGSSLVPNSAYYANSTWGRDTYVVVEYARITAGAQFDAGLAALVDRTKAKSLTNFAASITTSGAVKTKFGFLAPSDTTTIRAKLS